MRGDLSKNHFELFDLPVDFELDTTELAARYRELQRHFHPDRFASASEQERRLSMQLTAQINEAFQTLKDPLSRARYMLLLAGIDINSETDTAMDPGFLMEQMELREALQAVREQANPQAVLMQMADDVRDRQLARIAQLKPLLVSRDPAAYDQARNLVREMQFLDKLRSEVEVLEERLV